MILHFEAPFLANAMWDYHYLNVLAPCHLEDFLLYNGQCRRNFEICCMASNNEWWSVNLTLTAFISLIKMNYDIDNLVRSSSVLEISIIWWNLNRGEPLKILQKVMKARKVVAQDYGSRALLKLHLTLEDVKNEQDLTGASSQKCRTLLCVSETIPLLYWISRSGIDRGQLGCPGDGTSRQSYIEGMDSEGSFES